MGRQIFVNKARTWYASWAENNTEIMNFVARGTTFLATIKQNIVEGKKSPPISAMFHSFIEKTIGKVHFSTALIDMTWERIDFISE